MGLQEPKNVQFVAHIGMLAASSKKRIETVWRPSVCLSVPSAYSLWLTRVQHATYGLSALVRKMSTPSALLKGFDWLLPFAILSLEHRKITQCIGW